MRTIQCPHNKAIKEDVYIYELNDCELWLCDTCHCMLAEKVFSQLAIEHFASTKFHAMQHEEFYVHSDRLDRLEEQFKKSLQDIKKGKIRRVA